MRFLPFALIAAAVFTGSAAAQFGPVDSNTSQPSGDLNANRTLFAVMVAANLSGYDDGMNLLTNSPLRQKVRDKLANQRIASLTALRSLLRDTRPKDPASELNRYIQFAILSAGPPDYKPARSDLPRPPSVEPLNDLPELLAEFDKEAHLDDLWKEFQPEYDAYLDQFAPPLRRALLEANGYLRNDSAGYLGSRFLVWIEPLGAPNQVQSFTYMENYNVVVTPFAEIPTNDVRHEYLHYLLEPLTNKYSAELQTKSALYDYAQNAPLVAEAYQRSQWVELATECLIKAIEARLARKPAMVDQALREGYILTPAFAEQLAVFESQESAMRVYLPDMIDKIDVKKEQKRLAKVQFVSERTVRTIHVTPPPVVAPPPLTGVAKTLDDAEKELNAHGASDRKVDGAKELFLRSLQESDQNSVHARSYYGLARVAYVEHDLDTSERLFHKALELDPDPVVKSWCLFYLGRLSDNMQGGREQAQEFYKSALAVPGVPDQVRKLAEQGLNQPTTNTK